MRDPFLTPCGLQEKIPELRDVARSTIRNIISKELKIPSHVAARKPFLTEAQKQRRLDWAKRHENWSGAKWSKVLWSDETHIPHRVVAGRPGEQESPEAVFHLPVPFHLCHEDSEASSKVDDLGLIWKWKARRTLLCCSKLQNECKYVHCTSMCFRNI